MLKPVNTFHVPHGVDFAASYEINSCVGNEVVATRIDVILPKEKLVPFSNYSIEAMISRGEPVKRVNTILSSPSHDDILDFHDELETSNI